MAAIRALINSCCPYEKRIAARRPDLLFNLCGGIDGTTGDDDFGATLRKPPGNPPANTASGSSYDCNFSR